MNIAETTQALALAQAFDNRTVGEVNIRAWFSVLFRADADDVMAAIRDHYAGTTEWIMPAHILAAVSVMAQRRAAAATATGWAPGQYGVPRDEAVPEVTPLGRLSLSDLPAAVAGLVARVRADLPEGSREALMPRTVAWEREHAAFHRQRQAEPNPHYRPKPPEMRSGPARYDRGIEVREQAEDRETEVRREICRENGPHDEGYHVETCPDRA